MSSLKFTSELKSDMKLIKVLGTDGSIAYLTNEVISTIETCYPPYKWVVTTYTQVNIGLGMPFIKSNNYGVLEDTDYIWEVED